MFSEDPDPLSAVMALLRPSAVPSKPITGKGTWGLHYPVSEQPGFCFALAGGCWIQHQNILPEQFETHDFLLLLSSPPLTLGSALDVGCRPRGIRSTARHLGEPGGRPDFEMLDGIFHFESASSGFLLGLLPKRVHLRADFVDTSRLARLLELVIGECAADRPAREMMLSRLVEILLLEILRKGPSMDAPVPQTGLLAGLHDPLTSRALRALHADVSHGWTVRQIASHVGSSRATLFRRFATAVGAGPMEYLTRWRMSLAADALVYSDVSLERLARATSYESAKAFSAAFRKCKGCAPRTFASRHRAHRLEAQAGVWHHRRAAR
jgi:AraC-like DNA-binding protein